MGLGAARAWAAPSFSPLRLRRSVTDSTKTLDRIAALKRVQQSGRVTRDAFMRPGGRLGILKKDHGRWLPARGVPDRRAGILREGSLDALSLGELGRATSPEASALGKASVPGQDTVRILVLRIDFLTDRGGSTTTGDGKFDLSDPGASGPPVDAPPHNRAFFDSHMEALRRYYSAETHGRLVLQWDIYPQADSAYHANDMDDYGPWTISQDVFPLAYAMVQAFLAAADTQDTSIPWAKFDRIAIFHAGSDLQSDTHLDSPKDIPTFTIGLDSTLAIPVADSSFYVFGGAILPETANQDGNFAALNAVVAHESGHNIFGWRDVYDVFSGFPVCGFWTLMDTGNLTGTIVQTPDQQQFFAIGLLPPLADPYQCHLAYDDVPLEVEITQGTTVDSLSSPLIEAKALKVPLSSEEYLLLENRQGDLNGDGQIVLVRDTTTGVILGPAPEDSLEYDFLLPGYGVLAWQVDESVVAFDPPGRRADDFYSLNGNPDRRGLHILEGDALQDLGDFTSPFPLGSPLDPFFKGNGTQLSPTSRPPLITNSGTNPHITVDVLDSLRLRMGVRVRRDWQFAGWPVKARATKGGIEPLGILFPSVSYRVVFAAGDSAIHCVRPDGVGAGAPGLGDVLFKAPAPVSPVARFDHPTLGPLVVSVYPDPAQLNDKTWSTNGSWVVAVDGQGNVAPGFPLQLPFGASFDWITVGPMVAAPSAANGNVPHIVVGTRSGGLRMIAPDAGISAPQACIGSLAGSFSSASPILALASFLQGGGQANSFAMADSLGNVGLAGDGPCPLISDAPIPSAAFTPGWSPTLAWAELNNGANSTTQTGSPTSFPQLAVLDRKTGDGGLYTNTGRITELRGLNAPLTKGVAVGDLDGDGFNEVVVATQDGRVGQWNLNGSATPSWPKDIDPEPFAGLASPTLGAVGDSPGVNVVMATGSGRIIALDAARKVLPGWPLGTGAGQQGSASLLDIDGDGFLEVLVGDADSLLYAFQPGAASTGLVWPIWGGSPGRNFALVTPPTTGGVSGSGLVVSGSLKCYPNPARRSPMTVAFQLTSPGQATLTVFDPSGRQIDQVSQFAYGSDNALVWNPSARAPGLYIGRLEVESGGKKETHLVQLGVLH